jgi:hypothetical protein
MTPTPRISDLILGHMQPNVWYISSQIAGAIQRPQMNVNSALRQMNKSGLVRRKSFGDRTHSSEWRMVAR